VPRAKPVPLRRSEKLEPVKQDLRLGTTVYKSECFSCNQGCDAVVHVDREGKVVRVEGDRSSHVTKGTLCSKGLASPEHIHHRERILYPLKRVGKKGEGRWERISWDEALDTTVGRLNETEKKYGKDGIMLAVGTSRGWLLPFYRFANAYGVQYTAPGTAQCALPRFTGSTLVGGTRFLENPDYEHTRTMLVWGANPTSTFPAKGRGMMEAWIRGATLIVVDPMLTEASSKADLWVQLRPGTDAALALGMLNVIIQEGLYDKAFVEKWCRGFEGLKKRAAEFSPERVSEITWVPKETIIRAARLYATEKPSCITIVVAIEQNADILSTCRAIAMLAAITGNIDVPGGNLIQMPVPVGLWLNADLALNSILTEEQHKKRLGSEKYPLLSGKHTVSFPPSAFNPEVGEAMLTGKPYPIRAMYSQASNMVLAYSNSKMVLEAIQRLDFFACVDFYHNETNLWANIILLAATWMERDFVTCSDQVSPDAAHLQQKTVQGGECWSDVKILNELAKRLGFADRMFPTDEAFMDFLLQPAKMNFADFKKKGLIRLPWEYKQYEKNGFATPTGKVQLHDPKLENLGFDPYPGYIEPTESPISTPELAKEYPLIITTGGRVPVFRHAEFRNIGILREIVPNLTIFLHPETAAKYGIRDRDWIVVESPRGSVEGIADFTPGIDRRVVQVASHWPGKSNVNVIMDNEKCAPVVGSAQLRCQLCRIRKR
ncbi:MAG: molybdopterin-dependent oxidoreductase, partial [Deltaproteobacteria bacterium]|nr:molybdopterin-dependent oxidoreductase [Deltaproteobacteria bacterium]